MRLNGFKILLIDDDNFVQNILSLSLRQNGAEVFTANSGEQATALYLARTELLDLVISDLEMPDTDGYELARRFKKARPDLPVYLLSAAFDQPDATREATAEVNGYFAKPIDIEQLIRHICQTLMHSPYTVSSGNDLTQSPTIESMADWEQLFQCLPQKTSQINYLNVFLDTYGHIATEFQTLADHHDVEGIRRLCHKMRGAAGILNCQSVMRACSLLEKHIKQHQASSRELLSELIDKLNLLLVEVNAKHAQLVKT